MRMIVNGENVEVKDTQWQEKIEKCWEELYDDIDFLYPNNSAETFFSVIWAASKSAFDMDREVQVIVDDKNDLFISVGTPGFVSFADQEGQLPGMKLPLRCWIHTHPFGTAFWSGTDWKSIKTWRPVLQSAVVLGDNEYLAMNVENYIAKKVYYGVMEEPNTIVEYKTEEEELEKIHETQVNMSTEEAMKVMNGDDEE